MVLRGFGRGRDVQKDQLPVQAARAQRQLPGLGRRRHGGQPAAQQHRAPGERRGQLRPRRQRQPRVAAARRQAARRRPAQPRQYIPQKQALENRQSEKNEKTDSEMILSSFPVRSQAEATGLGPQTIRLNVCI